MQRGLHHCWEEGPGIHDENGKHCFVERIGYIGYAKENGGHPGRRHIDEMKVTRMTTSYEDLRFLRFLYKTCAY